MSIKLRVREKLTFTIRGRDGVRRYVVDGRTPTIDLFEDIYREICNASTLYLGRIASVELLDTGGQVGASKSLSSSDFTYTGNSLTLSTSVTWNSNNPVYRLRAYGLRPDNTTVLYFDTLFTQAIPASQGETVTFTWEVTISSGTPSLSGELSGASVDLDDLITTVVRNLVGIGHTPMNVVAISFADETGIVGDTHGFRLTPIYYTTDRWNLRSGIRYAPISIEVRYIYLETYVANEYVPFIVFELPTGRRVMAGDKIRVEISFKV